MEKDKRKKIKMGKKKKKRKGGNLIQTAFKFIRLGALVAPGIRRAGPDIQRGDWTSAIQVGLGTYGGIRRGGNFDGALLAEAWTPYLMASLATYGIPKLIGIIKRA